jgi:hypothetical protein
MPGITIKGFVQFRSSLTEPPGPVGEKEILALNPQRMTQILNVTCWSTLEPGSLNLKVGPGVVEALGSLRPAWRENGASVIYPAQYANIPKVRQAYLYFLGTASRDGRAQQVLVRRAQNPLAGVVELFAPVKLTQFFGVVAGDEITVQINAI